MGFEKVGPLAQALGFGGGGGRGGGEIGSRKHRRSADWALGGVEEGGKPPAGYSRGPGSPGWRRQVLPYRPGEDALPGKQEI